MEALRVDFNGLEEINGIQTVRIRMDDENAAALNAGFEAGRRVLLGDVGVECEGILRRSEGIYWIADLVKGTTQYPGDPKYTGFADKQSLEFARKHGLDFVIQIMREEGMIGSDKDQMDSDPSSGEDPLKSNS
jgi:hypothetical protein